MPTAHTSEGLFVHASAIAVGRSGSCAEFGWTRRSREQVIQADPGRPAARVCGPPQKARLSVFTVLEGGSRNRQSLFGPRLETHTVTSATFCWQCKSQGQPRSKKWGNRLSKAAKSRGTQRVQTPAAAERVWDKTTGSCRWHGDRLISIQKARIFRVYL